MAEPETATDVHERLGTPEFCRRIRELDPIRRPLCDRRDQVHTRLALVQRAWWKWVETNETELPRPLQELARDERTLLAELDRIDRGLEALWQAKMAVDFPETRKAD